MILSPLSDNWSISVNPKYPPQQNSSQQHVMYHAVQHAVQHAHAGMMASDEAGLHSVYIHIPFCRHICTYCAFNVYEDRDELIPSYVDALIAEIAWLGQYHDDGVGRLPVHTIYLGGGTPSVLSSDQIARIISACRASFAVTADVEVTIEANPNDSSASVISAWSDAGINRLSIGAQSSSARELDLYERQHRWEEAVGCIADAHRAGIDNLSIDLIFGTPGQTMRDWQATMDAALQLDIRHISLYGLELHGGTQLTRAIDAGQIATPDEDLAADMYEAARDRFGDAGFEHYEISNWGLPGSASRHNQQYWHNRPYLGIGCGAHGYAGDVRTIVRRAPARYIEAFAAGMPAAPRPQITHSREWRFPLTPATAKVVTVTPEDELEETIMLGLRMTQTGVADADMQHRFGQTLAQMRPKAAASLIDRGLLEDYGAGIRLSREGQLLSNLVLRDLLI